MYLYFAAKSEVYPLDNIKSISLRGRDFAGSTVELSWENGQPLDQLKHNGIKYPAKVRDRIKALVRMRKVLTNGTE